MTALLLANPSRIAPCDENEEATFAPNVAAQLEHVQTTYFPPKTKDDDFLFVQDFKPYHVDTN